MIIQATTMGGIIVEKAKWETPTEFFSLQVGHNIAVCLGTDDKNLISNVAKQSKMECSVDRSEDGKHSIVLTLLVKQVRHMIDATVAKGHNFSTMCVVIPSNRYVEQVMLYLLDPGKCDKRFVQALRGQG